MSQHSNEDELTTLLPDKPPTILQYGGYDEGAKNQSLDENSYKHVSFHAISYEVTQRKCFKKLMPKVILNNVRYEKCSLLHEA